MLCSMPRARALHPCLNSTPILPSDWVFVPTCRTWRHICAGSVSCQVPLPPARELQNCQARVVSTN